MKKKLHIINFKVDEEDLAFLDAKAKRYGLSRSAMIKYFALNGEFTTRMEGELRHPKGYERVGFTNNKPDKVGNVYLMKNIRNGYIKIGFTKDNPKYRERTLQAEEPDVELLNYWEGSISDEKKLHNLMISKNIRGEWFELTDSDIHQIEDYFE